MKVLFVSPGLMGQYRGTGRLASFQETDLQLLEEIGAEVQSLLWYGRPLGRLLRAARWADIVYCWSIADHAMAASLVARRLACVVGGYEFANLPECNYGNLISTRMRWITKWVWKRADGLLYVDRSLEEEATRAFGHPGSAFYVPTGYDHGFWTPGDGPRQDIAVTTCHAPTPERIRLKGVDLFLAAARENPNIEFHIAGELPRTFPLNGFGPNVVADGWMERDELRQLYRRSKVYCQFSLHEGLPNAVCEAMLCGCVPVGVRVNGIPTAIGDAGLLVDRDAHSMNEGIRAALNRDDLRSRARDRIVRTFPLERRRRELKQILDKLVSS